jgi:hypothetical protein
VWFVRWPRPAGVTVTSSVRVGARGHGRPAARRGRHRTKAERADRQRRESRGRIAPADRAWSLGSHPMPTRSSHAR